MFYISLQGFSCSLEERIELKIMGRKAGQGGSIKGSGGPGGALASSLWHSQGRGEPLHKIPGEKKGAKASREGRGMILVGSWPRGSPLAAPTIAGTLEAGNRAVFLLCKLPTTSCRQN